MDIYAKYRYINTRHDIHDSKDLRDWGFVALLKTARETSALSAYIIPNQPMLSQLDRTKSWRTLSEFDNSALIFVSSLSVEPMRERPPF